MSTLTAMQLLTYQASQIGVGESPAGSNTNKYTKWYGFDGPWCFMFQCYCFHHFGALDLIHGKHAYVPDFKHIFEPHGEFHTGDPRPGDLVTFDFGRTGRPEHIGVVERVVSSAYIQTIEGNTSDHVYRRRRARSYVYAYATPNYARPNPDDYSGRLLVYRKGRPLLHGRDVRWVQTHLGVHHHTVSVDGYYGPQTATAVGAFQKAAHLEQDGVVGPHTWKALAT
jgi:peptidoglycan hydrolase-like protein with peptidoglycan-binding domain